MAARPAIGQIVLGEDGVVGKDDEAPSGFAISAHRVLTAHHCVCDEGTDELTAEPVAFQLDGSPPLPATVEKWDADADIALLVLDEPLSDDWEPLPIACHDESLRTAAFQSIGFPSERPFSDPFTVGGHVVNPAATIEGGIPAIQLFCQEVAARRDPSGFSGAPVKVEARWRDGSGDRSGWVAVGLVRWAEPVPDGDRLGHGGTVFAAPLSSVSAISPEVKELLVRPTWRRQGSANEGHGSSRGRYPMNFADELAEAEDFVGREALLARIRRFPAEADRGYVHLEASAGLGKSAFAARFATLEQAPVFFADSGRDSIRGEQCLRHLSAELILAHGLDPNMMDEDAVTDSTTLSGILKEVTDRRVDPVWLVVDGLDEAEQPQPGANRLLLPRHLPKGVFVLVTSREPPTRLRTDPSTPLLELSLSAEGASERADLQLYVERRFERDKRLRKALEETTPPLAARDFAERLADVAEGNFMYVTYALADFATGDLDLDRAPRQLAGYYESHFWGQMEELQERSWEDWEALYQPVLERLAVAAEPVSAEWLATQVGRPAKEIETRALRPWRRFLRVVPEERLQRWRIVHRSFADFLGTQFDLEQAHRDVAAAIEETEGPYRQRHLTQHLRAGGEVEELLALVRDPDWQDLQLAGDPTGQLFIHDVEQAWMAAEAIDGKAAATGDLAPRLAAEFWSALAIATVRTSMQAVPPALLAALVEEGMWSMERARKTVDASPDPGHRALALLALARRDPTLLEEALAAARKIHRPLVHRVEVTAAVARQLPEDRRMEILGELLDQVRQGDPYEGPHAVAALLDELPDELLPAVFEIARTAPATVEQAVLFLALAGRRGAEVAADPVAVAALESEHLPPRLLTVLAVDAGSDEAAAAAAELLDELDAEEDGPFWAGNQRNDAWVLAALAPRLDAAGLRRAVERAGGAGASFFSALGALATALFQRGEPDAALDALVMEGGWRSIAVLGRWAPQMSADLATRALAAWRDPGGPYRSGEVVGLLAPRLPDADRQAVLADALPETSFADEEDQALGLRGFLPYLVPRQATEAVKLLNGLNRDTDLSYGLAALAPALSQRQLGWALDLSGQLAEKNDDLARAAVIRELSGDGLDDAARIAPLFPDLGPAAAVALVRRLDDPGREDLLTWIGSGLAPSAGLVALALSPHLSEEQVDRAASLLDEAGTARLAALRAISPGEAFSAADLARRVADLGVPSEVLAHVVGTLADRGRQGDALELAEALGDDTVRLELIERLKSAPGPLPAGTAEVAEGLADWAPRLRALKLVADELDRESLREICGRLEQDADRLAGLTAEQSQAENRLSHRAEMLPLYARLPAADRADVVAELERELAESDPGRACRILSVIDPAGSRLPADVSALLYGALSRFLHQLSLESRGAALTHLGPLAPIVVALAGPQGAGEVGAAILDVGERWS